MLKEEEYVVNLPVEAAANSVRVTRGSNTHKKAQIAKSSNSQEEKIPQPKTKKIHHMTLKALQRKKQPIIDNRSLNPDHSQSNKPKRKYVKKWGANEKIEGQIQENQEIKLEEVNEKGKRRGGKKKKIEPVLEVLPEETLKKIFTIPKIQTYDNYNKYYGGITEPTKETNISLIFNKFGDPNYTSFVRSLSHSS